MTGGFGFPLGCVGVVAAAVASDLAGATGHPWYALSALAAVVCAAALTTTARAATAVAAVAWAVDSGFILGREGRLVFDAATAWVAVVLGLVLLGGLVVARLRAGFVLRRRISRD